MLERITTFREAISIFSARYGTVFGFPPFLLQFHLNAVAEKIRK